MSLKDKLPDDFSFSEAFLGLSFLGLCIYALGAPFSISLREVGGSVATFSLLFFYMLSFRSSRLVKFRMKYVVLFFLAVILLKSIFTVHPSLSQYALVNSSYKSLFLFLAGLESVNSRNRSFTISLCFGVSVIIVGVFGLFEWFQLVAREGSYLVSTRLTGPMDSPRVANWISLALPLAIGAFFYMKHLKPRYHSYIYVLALSPVVILILGSQTRSAWLGLVAYLGFMVFLKKGWKVSLVSVAATVSALFFAFQSRFSLSVLLDSPRLDLWKGALVGFLEKPMFGWGVNTYEVVQKSIDYSFMPSAFPMPHPHNIYIQFLVETGIVGFLVLTLFLFGVFFFLVANILKIKSSPLLMSVLQKDVILATHKTGAFLGYLVTAFTAHNFFRTWWLGTAMLVLGCALGSVFNLIEKKRWYQPI